MPGRSIESLKPVSKIRRRDIPSMSTKIEGVPRSNKTETEGLSTAFSEWLRRRELPSLTPLGYPSNFPFGFRLGLIPRGMRNLQTFARAFISWRLKGINFPFVSCVAFSSKVPHALAFVSFECGFGLRIPSGFRSRSVTSVVHMFTRAAARACQLNG